MNTDEAKQLVIFMSKRILELKDALVEADQTLEACQNTGGAGGNYRSAAATSRALMFQEAQDTAKLIESTRAGIREVLNKEPK